MRIMLSGVAIEGGGAEQVIQDLALGFAERGHEVMIAFLESTDEIVPQLEAAGIRCERLMSRTELADSLLADVNPSCILKFRRLVQEFRPDIWHSHVPRPTLWASLALRTVHLRVPFVYTEHSIQEIYPAWAAWVYRLFLPVSSAVICVSEASRHSFAGRWERRRAPRRIWNGIRPERAAPLSDRAEIRGELGADATAPVVCNVANLTYHKGHDVLIDAMSAVHAELPEARCWIAGSVEHEPTTVEALRRAIATGGLGETVSLLGRRRDVPDLLSAADLFVLSSRQEGFPITILEAMAAGKAVIATDVGGCAEAVVDGETGLIVPPENPRALAEAMLALLADRERTREMGRAGRERVEREFTVDRMVEQHLHVYEQLVAGRA
ncbi:MAG: GT4 family glycosyltransferase PelF [Armatimonadota bacterium]|jgi:glycosyltransferase involved in cell wall biosynthesis